MSETTERDPITHRLVTALDALPVPEEPTGFAVDATRSLVRDPRLVWAAVLLIALVGAISSPETRRAAAELTRYIERIVFGPAWVGYYIEGTAPWGSGQPHRLLVASSESQGRPATPDIAGGWANHGPWSPDGTRITVSNDNRLYIGDRAGGLRAVGDVGADRVIFESGWLGNDKVWASAVRMTADRSTLDPDQPSLLVTVDLKTGALVREELSDIPGGAAPWTISPDGRWLVFGGVVGTCFTPPANSSLLHDRVTGDVFNVVDASGSPASLLPDFLSDGRLVIAQCDQVAHTLELFVGAPGVRPTPIAVVPISTRSPFFTLVSGSDDILVFASTPDAPQDAYVLDPSGRLLRRLTVPAFARPGTFAFAADLSRDEKSLGFTVSEVRADPFPDFALRAGVVDLVTGEVTYLCERDCAWLLVR